VLQFEKLWPVISKCSFRSWSWCRMVAWNPNWCTNRFGGFLNGTGGSPLYLKKGGAPSSFLTRHKIPSLLFLLCLLSTHSTLTLFSLMVPHQRICSTASVNGEKYNKEDDDTFAHSSAVVTLICLQRDIGILVNDGKGYSNPCLPNVTLDLHVRCC
jgi:hypothetical protein